MNYQYVQTPFGIGKRNIQPWSPGDVDSYVYPKTEWDNYKPVKLVKQKSVGLDGIIEFEDYLSDEDFTFAVFTGDMPRVHLYLETFKKNKEMLQLERGGHLRSKSKSNEYEFYPNPNFHINMICKHQNVYYQPHRILMSAHRAPNTVEMVKLLLENGVNLSLHIDRSRVPAFYDALAAQGTPKHASDLGLVRFYIQNGADVNHYDNISEKTPLTYACCRLRDYYDHILPDFTKDNPLVEVVRILLENGADVHEDEEELIKHAVSHNDDPRMLELLVSYGVDANMYVPYLPVKVKPLFLAVDNMNLKVTEKLLEYGADVNDSLWDGNKRHDSLLDMLQEQWEYFMEYNRTEDIEYYTQMVKLLLEHKLYVNKWDARNCDSNDPTNFMVNIYYQVQNYLQMRKSCIFTLMDTQPSKVLKQKQVLVQPIIETKSKLAEQKQVYYTPMVTPQRFPIAPQFHAPMGYPYLMIPNRW